MNFDVILNLYRIQRVENNYFIKKYIIFIFIKLSDDKNVVTVCYPFATSCIDDYKLKLTIFYNVS